MSRKNHKTLSDLAGDGLWWRVECMGCRHVAKLNPRDLYNQLTQPTWSSQLDSLINHLKCSRCGGKQLNHGPCYKPES